MKKFRLLFLVPLASSLLLGCSLFNKEEKKDDPGQQEKDEKKDFTGLSLNNGSVTYDGEEHTLLLQGELPAGATQTYVDGYEGGTLPGEYTIKILVQCAGYNDKVYTATLTITPAQFGVLTFEGATVHYDGEVHTLEVTGELPTGAEIAYTVGEDEFEGASAVGSYDITATVSLTGYADAVLNATLTIEANDPATADLDIEDFEDLTNNDLNSDWELKYFGSSGWVDPQAATLSIDKNQVIPGGEKTMKMSLTQQGAAFKATRALGDMKTFEKYAGFSLDTYVKPFADGSNTKLQVQFWFKDLPLPEAYAGYKNTYATFTLDAEAPHGWAHWDIPFTDDTLSIASGAIPASALSQLGYTFADFTMYLDAVAIIATPNYIDGKNINVNIDNIKLLHEAPASRANEYFISAGTYGNAEGENYLAFNIDKDMENGSFLVDGVKQSDLEIEKTKTGLICKDATTHGNGLIVTADIVGSALKVTNVSGAYQSTFAYLNNLVFEKHANINIDFTDQASYVGGKLHDDNWYQEKWDQTWQKVTDQMNVRGTAGDPHVNMVTGYYMDYRYTYTNAEKFGLANSFSMDIGNDFASGSYDIKLKVKLIKASGAEVFAVGSSSEYYVVPANTAKWQNLKFKLDDPIEVSAIQVVVKSTGGYNQYLYVDNIKLSYAMPEVTPEIHELTDGTFYIWNAANDAYRIDISDSLANATVAKYGSTDSYPMAVTVDGNNITIADKVAAGAGLTIVGEIGENEQIAISNVTGSMASAFSASLIGKTAKKSAEVSLDFADSADGSYYQESHWKESKYENSGWTEYAAPTDMRGKVDKNGNKVVNMHCGTGAKNFRYVPDLPIGPVNHLEVDLGNYWSSSAGTLRYKISLLDENDQVKKYVAGDGSNWATLDKDTSQGNLCVKQEFDFDLTFAKRLRITTSMGSGEAYLYMDNLKVNYKAPAPVVPTKTIEDGNYYIWNGNTDAFKMEISNSLTSAIVSKIGGDSYDMTVEVNEETVTFKDAGYAGAGLTIVATITETNIMKVTDVTGAMASALSGSLLNKTIKHSADVNVDFADGTVGQPYSNAKWTGQRYTTSWIDVTPDMNCRNDANSNKVVNLVSNSYTNNFIYTPDLPMGPVNHISFDMANYYGSSAGDIQVKVAVIDGGGTKYYALGDASNFVTIKKDTSRGSTLLHYDLPINLCVGYKIQFTTKAPSGNSYLYIDNINVSYEKFVDYKLNCTNDWDISASSAEFYAWVWGENNVGHWIPLELKGNSTDGFYFDASLLSRYVGIKIVRVNPEAQHKPTAGSFIYGTYTNEEVWNETGDITLNSTTIDFAF